MTCETCKNDNPGPNCSSCKGYCEIDRRTLMDFRRCEPWCFNGPACVRPGPPDCDNGSCSLEGKCLSPLATLLLAGVKGGCIAVCTDATGKSGFKLPGPGPCVVTLGDLDCFRFGPHFNSLRRSPYISPTAAEAIAATYEFETVTFTTGGPVVVGGNWYAGALGALGLSHQFCVYEVTATYDVGGVATAAAIIGVGVGGERIACGDGANGFANEGFYSLVAESPRKADPEELEVTDGRCRCRDLCALTPADGLEFIYVQATTLAGAPLPADTQLTVTARISRCNWFVLVDPCVGPLGNRLLSLNVISPLPRPAPRNADTVPFI